MSPLLATAVFWTSFTTAPIPAERAQVNKVVGVWRLLRSSNGGDQPGTTTVEFTADGKMILRQATPGLPMPQIVYTGTYRVINDTLPYSANLNGGIKAETLIIRKLTPTELIVEDPDGIREEFERVKPPAKQDSP